MLYDDYIAYSKKYKAMYGERVVVLMEVGSFFELYAVEDPARNIYEGANMTEICNILNIQSTRKSKAIPECSRSNPLMAGFPSYVLKKFLDILINEKYTIVLVEQTTPPPNPSRAVTQILSPATYMSLDNSNSSANGSPMHDNRYLMCFYLATCYDRRKTETLYSLSVSYIDVTTGNAFIFREDAQGDLTRVIQEASRIIQCHSPYELIIWCDESTVLECITPFRQWIKGLTHLCVHDHLHKSQTLSMFRSLNYQQSVLRKVYHNTGLLSPIEYIDMETRIYALTCYVYLINFAYEHNEVIVQDLNKPILLSREENMYLTNSSAEHLNIIPKHGAESSMMQLLNTCATAIGRRAFRDILLTPSIDRGEIEKRYETTAAFISNHTYDQYRIQLQSIRDLERLFRRMQLRMLQPSEMATIMHCLDKTAIISQMVLDYDLLLSCFDWTPEDHGRISGWLNQQKGLWNVDILSAWNGQSDESFYVRGIYPEIDQLDDKLRGYHDIFKQKVDKANEVCGCVAGSSSDTFFKLDTTSERHDYQITITKKRYEAYLASGEKDKPVFDAHPVSASNKTMFKLTYTGMQAAQQQIHTTSQELRTRLKTQFVSDLERLCDGSLMKRVVWFMGQIDVFATSAKNAVKYRYTRPICLSESSISSPSCLRAKGLRHPLIEVIQTDIPYVANDITLGDGEKDGLLLYGINASGKSSLMKSVGVNLILAQAGFYVAASEFVYRPYHHIFTRIPGGDNLFKQQSTFVAEIAELRTILQYSTHQSLCIGDELASGTESVSAISIVAAGIATLAERKATFIFATHLHEIAQLPVIQQIPNLRIAHLKVVYDENTKLLIYDRRLQDGSGDTLYGLEVCKSLDMPPAFLHLANTIRQSYLEISPTVVAQKLSKYSSKVFVDECSICHQPAKEVHHIQEQHKADAEGYIGHIHKNVEHNLMQVCETCHDAIHHKEIVVEGYAMTEKGRKLIVSSPSPQKKKTTIKSNSKSTKKQ